MGNGLKEAITQCLSRTCSLAFCRVCARYQVGWRLSWLLLGKTGACG
jgi:hypothetical protein